jgi:DNA polymerase III epsilon subunit-like protein
MIYTEYTLNTSKNTYFDGQYAKSEQLFFDIETTGLDVLNDGITEIGAVKIKGGEIKEKWTR